jgi:hypothetical protein
LLKIRDYTTFPYRHKKSRQQSRDLCPEQESNLHTLWAADFESAASTNSAIWACTDRLICLTVSLLQRMNSFQRFYSFLNGLQYYIIPPTCPKYAASIFSYNSIPSAAAAVPGLQWHHHNFRSAGALRHK